MSTEIYDDRADHSYEQAPHSFTLTQYYSGPNFGQCLQLTGRNCDDKIGYVGLTQEEVNRLVCELTNWLNVQLDEE